MMLFSGMTDEDLDQVVSSTDAVQIIKIVDSSPSLYIVVCTCHLQLGSHIHRVK